MGDHQARTNVYTINRGKRCRSYFVKLDQSPGAGVFLGRGSKLKKLKDSCFDIEMFKRELYFRTGKEIEFK